MVVCMGQQHNLVREQLVVNEVTLTAVGMFKVGWKKKECQDRICLSIHSGSNALLAAVFDGHGLGGESAAVLACNAVQQCFKELVDAENAPSTAILERCISVADSEILTKAELEKRKFLRRRSVCLYGEKRSFGSWEYGTTALVCSLHPEDEGVRFICSNVGDSRCFLFRKFENFCIVEEIDQ